MERKKNIFKNLLSQLEAGKNYKSQVHFLLILLLLAAYGRFRTTEFKILPLKLLL